MTTVAGLVPYLAGGLAAGGAAAALSRRRKYIRRWCAWMIAVPVVAGALYTGPAGAAALAAVAGVVCVAEYGRLARLPRPDRAVLTAAVAGLPFAAWLMPAQLPRLLITVVLATAMVPLLAGDATDGMRRLSLGVLGVVWFAPLAAVVLLGPTAALVLFAAVSVTDITASLAGRRLGGPRLSPLSPGKTWAGTLAGVVAGPAALAVLGALTWPLAVAVVAGAPLGDLLESMVKRGSGVKDSAGWLAGAGGLLDRLDSLLLTLALALLLR